MTGKGGRSWLRFPKGNPIKIPSTLNPFQTEEARGRIVFSIHTVKIKPKKETHHKKHRELKSSLAQNKYHKTLIHRRKNQTYKYFHCIYLLTRGGADQPHPLIWKLTVLCRLWHFSSKTSIFYNPISQSKPNIGLRDQHHILKGTTLLVICLLRKHLRKYEFCFYPFLSVRRL